MEKLNKNNYHNGWYKNTEDKSFFVVDFSKHEFENEDQLKNALYGNSLKALPVRNFFPIIKNMKVHVPL